MSEESEDGPGWLRPLTRAALIFSVPLAAAGLADPNNFQNRDLTPGFVVFVLILVVLALNIVCIVLSLRLLAKANRRPNLTVGVIAFVVLFLTLGWTAVANLA